MLLTSSCSTRYKSVVILGSFHCGFLPEQKRSHPHETQSDSFLYFVDNKLVMHNKADYSHADIDDKRTRETGWMYD
ncbi:protein unc-119 homolog B isoform X1 [Lates japonicus]|uniref:Protein unc-119 homolog B isoform X1 n=1 Tax=Lates japonicus TaxID=270547 RepID=A0AAD3MWR4_LATJO|nr:protein unc-119 homolog B isoform X1 [Lates japonicus]